MKKLRLMDSTGDSVVEFDPAQADADVTREAKALFERLTKQGAAVFTVAGGGEVSDRKVTNFDELADENVIVPRIVGG